MATAGRKPNATTVTLDDGVIDTVAVNKAAANLPILAAQTSKAMQAIGYELSYDRERVVQEARFFMSNATESMLETGKRLIVLKENEPHGDFIEIVEERLGLGRRAAQRLMQAAIKFLDPKLLSKASPAALLALGKTKLLELITEDSDDLEALADGGTIAGLTIDDIDRMSREDLRKALREARAEADADKALLLKKNAKIDDQARQMKRIKAQGPDEVLAGLQKETTVLMNDALGCLRGQLRAAFLALTQHHEVMSSVPGESGDSQLFMAGVIGQVQADVNALREEFNLPDVSNAATAALAAEVEQWAGKK